MKKDVMYLFVYFISFVFTYKSHTYITVSMSIYVSWVCSLIFYCHFLLQIRNATAIFIMNLSCSDLLFCCFNLPLAASTFHRRAWVHGHLLCKMFPLTRYALVANSLFTVLSITINRYVMIAHPKLYTK